MAQGKRTTACVEETLSGKYMQRGTARGHVLTLDEPADMGGNDAGPDPYELLLMALGSCTSITIRMYAEFKKIPLTHVRVELSHERIHAEDCAECANREGTIDRITRDIQLEGDELTDEQRERLLEIANRCPVHRTLTSESHVITRLV